MKSSTDDKELDRLIIENQGEDGSIDISDQAAMRDEILEWHRRTALAEALEIVGEDEPIGDMADGGYWMLRDARNKLRAELRQQLRKYYGGEADE